MGNIRSDGNGRYHYRFGPREWIGLVTIAVAIVIATASANWLLMDLKIDSAIAAHSLSQLHKEKQ